MTSSTQKIFLPDGTSYPIRKRELEDEVAAALERAQHEFDEADMASGAVPK